MINTLNASFQVCWYQLNAVATDLKEEYWYIRYINKEHGRREVKCVRCVNSSFRKLSMLNFLGWLSFLISKINKPEAFHNIVAHCAKC